MIDNSFDIFSLVLACIIIGITFLMLITLSLLLRYRNKSDVQEDPFFSLAENIPDNILRHDLDGRVLYANQQMAKTAGLSVSAIVGQLLPELLPVSEYPTCEIYYNSLAKVIATSLPMQIEVLVPQLGGDIQIHSVKIVPEFDAQGNIKSVLALGRDISLSRKLEDELREREAQLSQLAEHIPGNIIQVDATGKILYVNSHMQQSMSNRALTKGNNIFEALSESKTPNLKTSHDTLRHVIKSGETLKKIVHLKPNGVPQIHMLNYVPEFNAKGNVQSVLIIGMNITAQKKMEETLHASEREFRTLSDNFPYLLVRYDLEFRRLYANKIYAQTIGVEVEQVLSKSIDEVWSPNKHLGVAEFKTRLINVINHKVSDNFLIERQTSDGQILVREMYLVPEFDDVGEVISVLGIGHESNVHKKSMIDLETAHFELQSLTSRREMAREEERKHIAQDIHDELGQLLSVLHLQASMIDCDYGAQHPDLHLRAQKMMEVANKGIYEMHNLITQLRPVIFDYGFIHAFEYMAEDFSSNTGIICEFEVLPSGLESLTEPDLEESRALIVFRIVQEALTNIVRHAQATKIQIILFFDAEYMTMKINDNGVGFNVDAHPRVNAFGLVGMKERMVTLQGELQIISSLGKGTEVFIQIPIKLK